MNQRARHALIITTVLALLAGCASSPPAPTGSDPLSQQATAAPPTTQAPSPAAAPTAHADHTAVSTGAPTAQNDQGPCGTSQPIDLAKYGGQGFANPDELVSQNGLLETTLSINYTSQSATSIAGCPVHLRVYNNKLIGPTLRAKPGDTLRITLDNMLPLNPITTTHDLDTPHDFNTTNLHTHGLHVSPVGNSDNVLLEIQPQTTFEFEIKIPPDHPPGTYWYHPHNHGSTALQVSSGMEGALIVEGGLDDVPSIKVAAEQIMVFQQIPYDQNGEIEGYTSTQFGPCSWEGLNREHTINGQLYPTLTMRPGEVQRWRMIHAGVRESILPMLYGPNTGADTTVITDILKLPQNDLYEIALDGIALGQIDRWPVPDPTQAAPNNMRGVELEPGYRSDVLVKAGAAGTYYLVDKDQPDALTCPDTPEQPNLLAKIVVSGAANDMALPADRDVADLVPLPALIALGSDDPADPKPTPTAYANQFNPGFQAVSFSVTVHNSTLAFLASERPFSFDHQRTIQLGNFDEWILETKPDSLYYAHPFHIHVNPFKTWRAGTDGKAEMIWKDTMLVPQGPPLHVYTHYTDYIGTYVYHCHILDHEDQGMMEIVNIVN